MRTAAVRAVPGLVLAMGAVAIAAAPSLAEVRFGVAPSWLWLATSAEGGGSVEVRAQNTGDVALAVQALVRPFRDQAGDRSAEAPIAVAPAAAEVAPGDAAVFTVTIAVPDGLASGGRYATLLLETRPEAVDGNTTELAGRIEVPVWIAVRGDGEITRIPVLDRFAAVLERDGRPGAWASGRSSGTTGTPTSSPTRGSPSARRTGMRSRSSRFRAAASSPAPPGSLRRRPRCRSGRTARSSPARRSAPRGRATATTSSPSSSRRSSRRSPGSRSRRRRSARTSPAARR